MAVAISAEDLAPEMAEACFGNVGAVDDDDDSDDGDMMDGGKDAVVAKPSANGNSETLDSRLGTSQPNLADGNCAAFLKSKAYP